MKSLLPVLILGLILAVIVFGARCAQDRMHDYETQRLPQDASNGSPSANTAPNKLAEEHLLAELFPDTTQAASGIRFRILQEGAGPKPVAGNRVHVRYTGRLLDGTVFDRSSAQSEPFAFTLMRGEVIRGWDRAVLEMRAGEKRFLVVPSRLAYGRRGRPPAIPPHAPLVFEIELVKIDAPSQSPNPLSN